MDIFIPDADSTLDASPSTSFIADVSFPTAVQPLSGLAGYKARLAREERGSSDDLKHTGLKYSGSMYDLSHPDARIERDRESGAYQDQPTGRERSPSWIEEPPEESESKIMARVVVMYYLVLIGDGARGVVLPSMVRYYDWMINGYEAKLDAPGTQDYLAEYSLALTAFSLGRAVSGPALGFWADSTGNPKKVLLCGTSLLGFSNLLYALCYDFGWGTATAAWCIVFRFFMGAASGQLGVLRGYVADMVPPSQRTKYLAYLSLVQYLGFTMTALIGGYPDFSLSLGIVTINQFTVPGYVMFIAGIVGVCLIQAYFPDPTPKPAAPETEPNAGYEAVGMPMSPFTATGQHHETLEEVLPPTPQPPQGKSFQDRFNEIFSGFDTAGSISVIMILNLNIVTRANLACFENLATQISEDFGFNATDDSYTYGCVGVIGVIAFFFIEPMSNALGSPRRTLFVGMGVMCLADFLFMTLGLDVLGWYLTGFGLAWGVAYPITQTMIIVVFAEALEGRKKNTLMGILGVAGSVGRVVAPLWISPLGADNLWIAFFIPLLLTALYCAVLMFVDLSGGKDAQRAAQAAEAAEARVFEAPVSVTMAPSSGQGRLEWRETPRESDSLLAAAEPMGAGKYGAGKYGAGKYGAGSYPRDYGAK